MIRPAALLLALVAIFSAGCAGPLKTTGYLDDYKTFNAHQEKTFGLRLLGNEDRSVDEYFLTRAQVEEKEKKGEVVPTLEAAGIDKANLQPVVFIVHPPEWNAKWSLKKKEEQEEVLFTIRERLYKYLLRQYPAPVRVRYALSPDDPLVTGYRVLDVETVVTDAKPGVGWLRFWIGYGAGATVLQLEGRVREEGNPVAEFAIRNAHAGYPNGFLNTRVHNTSYCLRYAAEEEIGKLAPAIREQIPAARVRPGHSINVAGTGAAGE